jgi:hypothetical protein
MEPRLPTVGETPHEHRPVLVPVEKLKKLWLVPFNEYKIKEFRLQGGTETLKDFVDLCFLEKRDKNRIVWITENAFVRLGGIDCLPEGYRNWFGLQLSTNDYVPDHDLSIHSSTIEEAIAALDLLVGLNDSYFKTIELRCGGDAGRNRQRPFCPLRGRHLENFVRNANRENRFCYMMFTRDQCRTLATSGIRTKIGFWTCEFEDEGIAFVEALSARESQESGPAKLSFWATLPFDEANFRLFLRRHNLESLTLYHIRLRHEESCRAMAVADLQNIEFHSCLLADGGAALVDSVRAGRGPRGLRLGRLLFDSAERFLSFINALRGNTYLERLGVYYGEDSPQALASALLDNKGLVHFRLDQCGLDGRCWNELMAAISTHPTLRTLQFRGIYSVEGRGSSSSEKRARTKAVADMLLVNKHVDEIPFCSDMSFGCDDWNALVDPILECNLYRKRFVAIQKIQEPSVRAAVVAQALARVEKKPSLVWMVLSHIHDIVCSYQDTA